MMQGKLIVLEGNDGSGKSTQYRLLRERLEAEGAPFRSVTFPRYDQESSVLIRMYLSGAFGSHPGDVNAYAASVFYAVDRYAAFRTDWGDYYKAGGVILSDRYTTSNACHQGAKVPRQKLQSFLDWLYDFEFRIMELPRPDLVLYLDVDVEASQRLMRQREAALGEKGDIHETDLAYLRACQETGRYAAAHYGWERICCMDGERLRSVEEIHEEIYQKVKEAL